MTPFLKIFLDKNANDSDVVCLGKGEVLSDSVHPYSLDYLIVEDLNYDINNLLMYLKSDGELILFGENDASYLNLARDPFVALGSPNKISRFLKSRNLHYQVIFTCDAQKQRLFFGKKISNDLIPPLLSGRDKLRNWLFKSRYFQLFMPFWGVVASRASFRNSIFTELVNKVKKHSFHSCLLSCFVSKTGIVIFEFPDVIIRLGLKPEGSNRVHKNAQVLVDVQRLLKEDERKKVPRIFESGSIGKNQYCIESKIKGVDAESFIFQQNVKKGMTIEAASFLIELSMRNHNRVKFDKDLSRRYVQEPLRRVSAISKKRVTKLIINEIEKIVVEGILGEEIPVVISHGDYKLENMRFDPATMALSGIFDWDLSTYWGLPVLDLYHLLISNDVLIHDSNLLSALKNKLFPFQLNEWERAILWDYFNNMRIPKHLERSFALMYLFGQLDKRVSFSPSSGNISQVIDDCISVLEPALRREVLG